MNLLEARPSALDPSVRVAFLAALVESSDDAIVSADLAGAVTSWNRGAERMFGYAEEEMLGRDVTSVYPPDRLREKALIRDVLRRGERLDNFETVRLRKDGSAVEVAVTHSPIFAASGRMVGVLSIGRDIGERKAGEAIRSRLAAIVESSDDAIVSKDLWGRILTWNAGAAWLFGHTAEEAVGRPVAMLLPPERAHEEEDIMRAVCAGDKIDHQLTTRLTKDRRLVDVFVSVSPIRDARGGIVGVSTLIQDATGFMVARREQEQWTAELERRVEARTAELRTAVEEMEAFAYSASHDLRAPLRTVELCARMLDEDEGSTLTDEAKASSGGNGGRSSV